MLVTGLELKKKTVRGHKLKPVLSDPLTLVGHIGPSTSHLQDRTWNSRRLVRSIKVPASSPDSSSFFDEAFMVFEPDTQIVNSLILYQICNRTLCL